MNDFYITKAECDSVSFYTDADGIIQITLIKTVPHDRGTYYVRAYFTDQEIKTGFDSMQEHGGIKYQYTGIRKVMDFNSRDHNEVDTNVYLTQDLIDYISKWIAKYKKGITSDGKSFEVEFRRTGMFASYDFTKPTENPGFDVIRKGTDTIIGRVTFFCVGETNYTKTFSLNMSVSPADDSIHKWPDREQRHVFDYNDKEYQNHEGYWIRGVYKDNDGRPIIWGGDRKYSEHTSEFLRRVYEYHINGGVDEYFEDMKADMEESE